MVDFVIADDDVGVEVVVSMLEDVVGSVNGCRNYGSGQSDRRADVKRRLRVVSAWLRVVVAGHLKPDISLVLGTLLQHNNFREFSLKLITPLNKTNKYSV